MKKIPDWYVITGGPDSGKTTIIDYLKDIGYHVVPEYTRMLIDKEMKRGKTIQEIRGDVKTFQEKALKLKLHMEKTAPKNKTVFFDRGIPDTIAYYKFHRLKIPEKLVSLGKNRYKKVFILELLPYKNDYARTETAKEAKRIHNLIKQVYRQFGYRVITVPVMSVEKRVELILNKIE